MMLRTRMKKEEQDDVEDKDERSLALERRLCCVTDPAGLI